MTDTTTYYVYGLLDPRYDVIRYIGVTYNIKKRYKEHILDCNLIKNSHKNNWIKQLKKFGLLPGMYILEQYSSIEEAYAAESELIQQYKNIGYDLTNQVDGGRGGTKGRVLSEESKKKIGDAHRGMRHSDETKEKISNSKMGSKQSLETVEKRTSKLRGKKLSEEARHNMAKAATGRKHTEETKEKLRQINTGKTYSEATKQKHRDAWEGDKHPTRGKKLSKERIERGANTRRGKYIGENNKLFGTSRPQEVTDKMIYSMPRKLSFEQIINIRELWATGQYKQKQLASMFGVKQQHISKIVNNKKGKIPSNYTNKKKFI